MDYVVLFDVATKPRGWLDFPWPFFVAMLAVFFIVGELERDADEESFLKRNGSRLTIAIVLIVLALGVYSYETDRTRWIAQLARGHVNTVEGEVSNVTVKRAGKSSSRVCFTVQSETFCYNTGETTPAMNYCAAPISPGLWVRVSYHYYGNPILRLEAREEAVDPANVSEQ
jgi:hypothetical protein